MGELFHKIKRKLFWKRYLLLSLQRDLNDLYMVQAAIFTPNSQQVKQQFVNTISQDRGWSAKEQDSFTADLKKLFNKHKVPF